MDRTALCYVLGKWSEVEIKFHQMGQGSRTRDGEEQAKVLAQIRRRVSNNLIGKMSPTQLGLQCKDRNTALHIAIMNHEIDIAYKLICKMKGEQLGLPGEWGQIPLFWAIKFAQEKHKQKTHKYGIVHKLLSKMTDDDLKRNQVRVMVGAVGGPEVNKLFYGEMRERFPLDARWGKPSRRGPGKAGSVVVP